jgi:hypothetical protein
MRAMVLRWDEGVGCFCKSALISGGWRAVLCKMLPPLSLTFRSRSNVSHQSFHSLHQYLGFHLIRSLTNMPFYLLFRPLLYTMRSLALALLRATPVNPLFDPNSKSRGRRQKKKKKLHSNRAPARAPFLRGHPNPPSGPFSCRRWRELLLGGCDRSSLLRVLGVPTHAAPSPPPSPSPTCLASYLGRRCSSSSTEDTGGGANRPLLHRSISQPRARFPDLQHDSPAGAIFTGPLP